MTKKKDPKDYLPVGRPESYTKVLGDKVCELLVDGKSMRSISRMESMPCTTTMFKWLREIPEFTKQYEKAKLECHHSWFEDIMDIADDSTNDFMTKKNKDGDEYDALNAENIQRSRLRVDTRKWALSKLMPKKYGDRIQQDVTLPEGVSFNMSFGTPPKADK